MAAEVTQRIIIEIIYDADSNQEDPKDMAARCSFDPDPIRNDVLLMGCSSLMSAVCQSLGRSYGYEKTLELLEQCSMEIKTWKES